MMPDLPQLYRTALITAWVWQARFLLAFLDTGTRVIERWQRLS